MIPARHIRWGIAALLAALILVLAACESPTPTPTPPLSPTPTPEPTPEPTAVERLAWFDAPTDVPHWIAWSALRRMAIDDEPLSQQIASLDWVTDGITAEEAGALDDVSWLLRENPDIADTALNLPWMATNGDITPDDRRALRAIRAAADADAEFGAELAAYGWLPDGATTDEADALETLGEIVAPGFTNQTATGIGATRVPSASSDSPQTAQSDLLEIVRLFADYSWVQDDIDPREPGDLLLLANATLEAAPSNASLLRELVGVAWIQDGMTDTEAEAVGGWTRLIDVTSENGSFQARSIWEYGWAKDDVTEPEVALLENLAILAETAGGDYAGVMEIALSYDWLQDDVTPTEAAFFRYLPRLITTAGEQHEEALETTLAHAWIVDGITQGEPLNLRRLEPLFETAGPEDAETLQVILGYDWVVDGIGSSDTGYAGLLSQFMGESTQDDYTSVLTVARYPWMSDSISSDESFFLRKVGEFLQIGREAPPDYPQSLRESILKYEWLRDDVEDSDVAALSTLARILRNYNPATADFVVSLVNQQWLKDELEVRERDLLWMYVHLMDAALASDPAVLSQITGYSWVSDGITDAELQFLRRLMDLLLVENPAAQRIAVDLVAMPWFQDNLDHFDMSVINLLIGRELILQPEIAELGLSDDGISEKDVFYLMALGDALNRSEHQYRDLLTQHYIDSRTLAMPLAGDIELTVVRHTRFPDGDPTLDLTEDITLQLEEFMGVPFPLDNILILIMEASVSNGESPKIGVAYAFPGHIVMVPPRHNPGFHLAVFHEVSHLYWGGHTGAPSWWTEGAAGFLPDIARDALEQESLEVRYSNLTQGTRTHCRSYGLHNISDLYEQQILSPGQHPRAGCIYNLGELFLMEMYLLLGHDATSAAMRQIYVDARDSGWLDPITDQKIYDAFRANTPDEKFDDFRKLFLRLHGGANVDLSQSTP